MNELQIECFQAVFRAKSITSAADNLFSSVQAVSQNLNNLETELGTKLFTRSKSGVVPTEAGLKFYEFAATLESTYQSTLTRIRELYSGMASSFRIGISDYIDPLGLLGKGIAAFIDEHKTTNFSGMQYNNETIMEKLISGEIDIAIVCDSQIALNGDFEVSTISGEDLQLYISNIPGSEQLSEAELLILCTNISHIDAPYGIRTSEEWDEISKRMNSFLNVSLKNRYVMPNFISVIECANTIKCAVVCDKKFGYLHYDDDIPSIPINIDTSICCIWHKTNEHPLIPEFCSFINNYYKSCKS